MLTPHYSLMEARKDTHVPYGGIVVEEGDVK